MKLHPALSKYLRRRRARTLGVYALFALLQIPLVAWLILDFTTVTQFTVCVIEALAAYFLIHIDRKLHLHEALAPLHEGTIVHVGAESETDSYLMSVLRGEKQENLQQHGPRLSVTQTTVVKEFGLLIIDCAGKRRVYRFRTLPQQTFFRVGDRVLFSRAFAAPLLLSRTDDDDLRYACPACGTMIPAMVEDECFFCHLPAIIPEEYNLKRGKRQ